MSLLDLSLLGPELTSRAARFSRLHAANTQIEDGFLSCRQLDRKSPNPDRWWRVFHPLLRQLLVPDPTLSGQAALISLGYFQSSGKESRRAWLSFFANDLWSGEKVPSAVNPSPEEKIFLRTLTAISYAHNFREERKRLFPLITEVMELLNGKTAHHGSTTRNVQLLNLLRPIVIVFAGSDTFIDSLHRARFLLLDWRVFRDTIRKSVVSSRSADPLDEWLGSNASRLHEIVRKQVRTKDLPSLLTAEQMPDLVNAYHASLRQRSALLEKRARQQLGKGFRETLLGKDLLPLPEKEGRAPESSESDYLTYIVWLHDVLNHSRWSHLVGIPAWEPAESQLGASCAVVLYMSHSKGLQRGRGVQPSLEVHGMESGAAGELAAVANAVRSASVPIAHAVGEQQGVLATERTFAHSIEDLVLAITRDPGFASLTTRAKTSSYMLHHIAASYGDRDAVPSEIARPLRWDLIVDAALYAALGRLDARCQSNSKPLDRDLPPGSDEALRKSTRRFIMRTCKADDTTILARELGLSTPAQPDPLETRWAESAEALLVLALCQAAFHATASACLCRFCGGPFLLIETVPQERAVVIRNRSISQSFEPEKTEDFPALKNLCKKMNNQVEFHWPPPFTEGGIFWVEMRFRFLQ